MLDRRATSLIRPTMATVARWLVRAGLSANQLTLLGFFIGIFAAILIATGHYGAGAGAILLSRLLDGLDGAVARQTRTTDAGAFLDIALDFLFYAGIPLAFAVADPARNALAAAVLLAAFVGTGSSFLAFAVLAAKRGLQSTDYPDKSFFFLGGLTEASETLICFVAACLWPAYFPLLAYGFAILCGITIISRILWAWRTLS